MVALFVLGPGRAGANNNNLKWDRPSNPNGKRVSVQWVRTDLRSARDMALIVTPHYCLLWLAIASPQVRSDETKQQQLKAAVNLQPQPR